MIAHFDPLAILRTLDRHRVRSVIIGGIAGRLWGATSVTNDLAICYARDRSNLEALAAALRGLDARVRGTRGDVPFSIDAKSLRMGDHFTFATVAGNFDCLATPAGSRGYDALAAAATKMHVEDIAVMVASLDDLIAMKRAAGRPKDLIEAEVLAAVRDEREDPDR